MLSRAVVVERAGFLAAEGQRARRPRMHGRVRAAVEVLGREASPREHGGGGARVERLAAVRRGRESDLCRRQAETSSPPPARNGTSCTGFAAERRKTGQRGSPAAARSRPSSETTAIEPRWTDSTRPPRLT